VTFHLLELENFQHHNDPRVSTSLIYFWANVYVASTFSLNFFVPVGTNLVVGEFLEVPGTPSSSEVTDAHSEQVPTQINHNLNQMDRI